MTACIFVMSIKNYIMYHQCRCLHEGGGRCHQFVNVVGIHFSLDMVHIPNLMYNHLKSIPSIEDSMAMPVVCNENISFYICSGKYHHTNNEFLLTWWWATLCIANIKSSKGHVHWNQYLAAWHSWGLRLTPSFFKCWSAGRMHAGSLYIEINI